MINFASGMLWESTFAEHGWYGMNQHELTELLCLTIFANSWTWRWRSRLTWQSRKSMLHLLHQQAAVIDLLSLLCILWSVCLIAPRYVTEVPCLSCLGAMVQFLGSRMRRKSWRTDDKNSRREAARKTTAWNQQTYDRTTSWFTAFMEQYTLSCRFARRFPRVQLRVAYPGSDHRTWNGMEKKEGMFRGFSAKGALALGQQAAWVIFANFAMLLSFPWG